MNKEGVIGCIDAEWSTAILECSAMILSGYMSDECMVANRRMNIAHRPR